MNRGGARRGHLSTKVPNVKLRPAPRPSYAEDGDGAESSSRAAGRARIEQESAQARQEVLDSLKANDPGQSEDEAEDAKTKYPLTGLVVCITGIDKRRDEISKFVQTLGARHERDLTEDVTHLIASQPGSPKYRCAVKLGMVVVTVDWIDAIKAEWIAARPVDLLKVTAKHLLRPLQGLKIALTGFSSNPERSQELAGQIQDLGGVLDPSYLGGTGIKHVVCGTTDVNSSHVLSHLDISRDRLAKPSATPPEGQPWALWPEWLDDCRDTGVLVEERYYSIWGPLSEERAKVVKDIRQKQSRMNLLIQKRIAAAMKRKNRTKDGMTKRRKVNATHATDSSPVKPQGPAAVLEAMSANAGPAKSGDKTPKSSKWEDDASPTRPLERPADPFAKSRSDHGAAAEGRSREPLQNSQERVARRLSEDSMPVVEGRVASYGGENNSKGKAKASANALSTREGVHALAGVHVRVEAAFAELKPRIEGGLNHAGASLIEDPEASVEFTIVPWTWSTEARPNDGVQVTPSWLEFCIHCKRKVDPDEYIGCRPTKIPIPISNATLLRIHISGQSGFDKHALTLIIKKVGGDVTTAFTSKDTHLLLSEGTPEDHPKAVRAREWGIPIITTSFLRKCWEEGVMDPYPKPALRSKSTQHFASPMPGTGHVAAGVAGMSIGGRSAAATNMLAEQMRAALEGGKAGREGKAVRKQRPRPRMNRLGGTIPSTRDSVRSRSASILDADEAEFGVPSVDEESPEHIAPAQTQVLVSYSDPKAEREQKRFLAMLDSTSRSVSSELAGQSADSKLPGDSSAAKAESLTDDASSKQPPAAEPITRSKSATTKRAIKARNQPGTRR